MPPKQERSHRTRKQYPRYTDMPRDTDISWDDPYRVFGINILFGQYSVDSRLFMVKREAVMGKLKAGEHEMDLTADAQYRALRLIQHDENGLETGKVLYILYPNIYPYSTIHTDFARLEEVEPDWPDGVEFPQGSLMAEITKKDARTLMVDVQSWWRERGGNPQHKLDKSGGRRFKRP